LGTLVLAKLRLIICIIALLFPITSFAQNPFTIGIIKYRGGDWYACEDAVIHFLEILGTETTLQTNTDPPIVELTDEDIYQFPFLLINGHGQILLSDDETQALRRYLDAGGFLFANDDYGMDTHFRELMEAVYPNHSLHKLPVSHDIFRAFYSFPEGLPKIHEHDNKPAQALGIFVNRRLTVLYIYESDIVDGWEREQVHHDPEDIRQQALRFGINLVWYVLTH
jgi:hypothetical protein